MKHPKIVWQDGVGYITLYDDATMAISDGVGASGDLGRDEVMGLFLALSMVFAGENK